MVKVFASLIRKGLKTLDDIKDEVLREQVRRILEED